MDKSRQLEKVGVHIIRMVDISFKTMTALSNHVIDRIRNIPSAVYG